MKIELKKFNYNSGLSQETTAFTADLYVDNKLVGEATNEGTGGCTWVRHFKREDLAKIEAAEAFCKTLPDHTYPAMFGNPPLICKMDLELYIDLLVEKELQKKDQKKLEKKMLTHLMWGIPNGTQYKQIKLRVPLAQIPAPQLQTLVNQYKATFLPDEQFLNTNLERLGIRL